MNILTRLLPGEKKHDLLIERSQDVYPLLELNKYRFNNSEKCFKRDLNKVASIPILVIENFCSRNNISYSEFLKDPELSKILINDPSLRFFRTKPGRI